MRSDRGPFDGCVWTEALISMPLCRPVCLGFPIRLGGGERESESERVREPG